MKNITDMLLEAKEQVQSAGAGDATITASIITLEFMAEMALDWLKNPNKSADFYKGDGGQTVARETKNIKSLAEEIISKADDIQND